MPDFIRMLATFQQHMQGELTRTDALRPLIWPISLLLLALFGAYRFGAPEWITLALVWLASGAVTLYGIAYIYFAIREPDALRSEKYKLQKMAIEHGLYGDDQFGLKEPRIAKGNQIVISGEAPTVSDGSGGDRQ